MGRKKGKKSGLKKEEPEKRDEPEPQGAAGGGDEAEGLPAPQGEQWQKHKKKKRQRPQAQAVCGIVDQPSPVDQQTKWTQQQPEKKLTQEEGQSPQPLATWGWRRDVEAPSSLPVTFVWGREKDAQLQSPSVALSWRQKAESPSSSSWGQKKDDPPPFKLAWRHKKEPESPSPTTSFWGQKREPAIVPFGKVSSPRFTPPFKTKLASNEKPTPSATVPVAPSTVPAVSTITKSLSTLRIPSREFRDRCGTQGRKMIVETNFLALNLSGIRNNIMTHYDVNINPSLPKRLLRSAMAEFRKKFFPDRYPAFDGMRNLYSSGELPIGCEITGEVEAIDPESNAAKKFTITIKYATQVNLESLKKYMAEGTSLTPPQEAIQAIDVVLRNAPSFRFVQVGRSFFTPPYDRVVQLGGGFEMWYGFFQSAILGWKPFVNMDVAHKAFPSTKPIPDVLCELLKVRYNELRRELTPSERENFLHYIKGLKVDYMIPGIPSSKRTYKVNNIVRSAVEQRFQLESGQSVSVKDYFLHEKKCNLKYPHLPCLHVGSVNRAQPIYVPSELCSITKGQVVNRKMTSNMIKQAATSTTDRKRKIQEALRAVAFNADPCVREFGLSISDKFEKVEARILDPPKLEYAMPKNANKKTLVEPSKGVWKPSAFIHANRLESWVILCLNKYTKEDELRTLGKKIKDMGDMLGMAILPPLSYEFLQTTKDLEVTFRKYKQNKVQLVLVVVPDKGDVYSRVKREAELNVGMLTQCLKGRTMQRLNRVTCSNILLKINSKLNGINHTLSPLSKPKCLARPVMIVGADVTHPSPDQTDIPSIAAVSASHDPEAFQYNSQIRLQPPRMEIIEDLEDIMRKHLMFFYERTNGLKPERIIFFRDGVSEGQFGQVLNSEVNAIRRACVSLSQEYKPMVTFLVVQKRHHTRFFPMRDEDAMGPNRNVPPGTIVDHEITHPTEVDFYLVSHSSIQGVSRPTKYRLLWNDDEDMTEDQIEEVTYFLCHMFSRCTRSVSYPAPTYNAHLAAYRARVYLEGEKVKLTELTKEQKKCKVMDEILLEHPMFFV